MARTDTKPAFATWTVEFLAGRGYKLRNPDGQLQPAVYPSRDNALTAASSAQARTDAAARKMTRPCMCCQKPFESEGIHNRLCGTCRPRGLDGWNPHGIAPRSGRPR